MEKLDLTKLYKAYYMAKTKPEIVKFGLANYRRTPHPPYYWV
jgi:hypothetical protein